MSKLMTTTALAAMIAAASPLAYAQTTAPSPTTPPATHATPGERAMPGERATADSFTTAEGQLRASELIGSTVYDVQNQDVGSVKDVLLDRSGRVKSVVLDVGAFLGVGGKYVTVSLNDLKTDNNRLTLNQTKDQLKSAPAFHFKTP